ncbi:LEA type 2 family protein [Polaribacter tangerinus]|uniref:LEA type 2 family protein n=1 Tax=Polaribacter tangerinus TaxID=1920034 RepID=UPI000B4B8106|nr:LEA type 2 family protein [Polaribacter tangerinus]
MKKNVYFLPILLFFLGCSVSKQPIFLKVDEVQLVSFNSDSIHFRAAAFFENPNVVGGEITTDNLRVFVNGVEVAQVFSDTFKIPAKNEFSIPLKVVIPTRKITSNTNGGVLGGLLNAVLKKSISMEFKGNLKYKVLGFSKMFEVSEKKEVHF